MKKFIESIEYVARRIREEGPAAAHLEDRAEQCDSWAKALRLETGVISEERRDEIDEALDEFVSLLHAATRAKDKAEDAAAGRGELRRVTFRKGAGKAHRGVIRDGEHRVNCVCGCPGSNNGSLTNGAVIIAEGWEKANCCPNDRPTKRRVLKPLKAANAPKAAPKPKGEKSPKAKAAIVPPAAKKLMEEARVCRSRAAQWVAGGKAQAPDAAYAKKMHEREIANAETCERSAAKLTWEHEQATFEAQRRRKAPKAAREAFAKADAEQANAVYWRSVGNHGAARDAQLKKDAFLAQANGLIELRVSEARAKEERAEKRERLAQGVASLAEQIDALGKPVLLKMTRLLKMLRADGNRDFSRMSVSAIRRRLRSDYLPGGNVVGSMELERALREAMALAQGLPTEDEARAELAAEAKATADFAEYAAAQGQHESRLNREPAPVTVTFLGK